jgi:hypothetical protein
MRIRAPVVLTLCSGGADFNRAKSRRLSPGNAIATMGQKTRE